jgi:hypothetical protein
MKGCLLMVALPVAGFCLFWLLVLGLSYEPLVPFIVVGMAGVVALPFVGALILIPVGMSRQFSGLTTAWPWLMDRFQQLKNRYPTDLPPQHFPSGSSMLAVFIYFDLQEHELGRHAAGFYPFSGGAWKVFVGGDAGGLYMKATPGFRIGLNWDKPIYIPWNQLLVSVEPQLSWFTLPNFRLIGPRLKWRSPFGKSYTFRHIGDPRMTIVLKAYPRALEESLYPCFSTACPRNPGSAFDLASPDGRQR